VQFNSTPDAQEMAFKATRNMPFSLVLQKVSSLQYCAIHGLNFANVFFKLKKRLENKKNI